MTVTAHNLIAIIFRAKTGCRQYPFANAESIEAFVSRRPYCNERLRVMCFRDRRALGEPQEMEARDVPEHVRRSIAR